MARSPIHIRSKGPEAFILEFIPEFDWIGYLAIGTCSIALVAVLATTGVTPTARCLGMMTP